MLFEEILFLGIEKKRKHLEHLDAEITSLFEHYYIAWNNFVDHLGPLSPVPALHCSIKTDSIYDCLHEMERAKNILYTTVNNVCLKASVSNLDSLQNIDFHLSTINALKNSLLQAQIVAEVPLSYAAFLLFRYLLKSVPESLLSTKFNLFASFSFAAATMVLIDLLFSYITDYILDQKLDLFISNANNILSSLSEILQKETTLIVKVTQHLESGLVWLDSTHMLLVPKDNTLPTIFNIEDLEC
ncbi:MAG: hypothetical protein ACRCSG_03865 [Cellulosilyticaceae bacterium]